MGDLNLRPVQVYGLTETYARYTICEPQEAWRELSTESHARALGRQGVHNIISDQTGWSMKQCATPPPTATRWAKL